MKRVGTGRFDNRVETQGQLPEGTQSDVLFGEVYYVLILLCVGHSELSREGGRIEQFATRAPLCHRDFKETGELEMLNYSALEHPILYVNGNGRRNQKEYQEMRVGYMNVFPLRVYDFASEMLKYRGT